MRSSWLVLAGLCMAAQLPVLAAGKNGGGGGGVNPPGFLSLKVSDEVGPPGGVVQIKLEVTEPRPIIRGRFAMAYDTELVEDFLGISVTSPNGDACGVASWKDGALVLDLTSPGKDLGMTLDYPIVTIAVRIRPGAPRGKVSPFVLKLSESTILDLFGVNYPAEVKAGSITVGGTLSVHNVSPGGGVVNPGSTISILGEGFDARGDLRINTDAKYTYAVASANEIKVTAKSPMNLQSSRIVVKSGKETQTYYSYLRAAVAPAVGDTAITQAKPLLPPTTMREGSLRLTEPASTAAYGFALENPSGVDVAVRADLYSASGGLLRSGTFTVPAWSRLSVDGAAAFPGLSALPAEVRFFSNLPYLAMGLVQPAVSGSVGPVAVTAVAP